MVVRTVNNMSASAWKSEKGVISHIGSKS